MHLLDFMDDDVIDEGELDIDIIEPVEKPPITGNCEACGKPIIGKLRRYCDVECLRDAKELATEHLFE